MVFWFQPECRIIGLGVHVGNLAQQPTEHRGTSKPGQDESGDYGPVVQAWNHAVGFMARLEQIGQREIGLQIPWAESHCLSEGRPTAAVYRVFDE